MGVAFDPQDPRDFRQVLSTYATGVVIVSACADGVDHAMTANSFTSVSLDPPLVLLCVERRARFHAAIMSVSHWAVSILGAPSRDAASWFATRGRPLRGQFSGYATTRQPLSGALVLDDSLAWLEARTRAVHPGGDHDIVVAEVEALGLRDEKAKAVPPLLYYRHGFRNPESA